MTSPLKTMIDRAARVFGGTAEISQEEIAVTAKDIEKALKAEQYLLRNCRIVTDNSVAVIVPPMYHEVVTAKLRLEPTRHDFRHAQKQLEHVLHQLTSAFEPSPSGLGVTVAWGLPYFQTYVPGPATHYLPVDNIASKAKGETVLAVQDAIRFPSDPEDLILEDNHVAILLRSDHPDHIAMADTMLFKEKLDFWEVTSIRKGFIGGGFDGGQGLPKQKAMEAGIPGAELIPDGAELFLGFTSSQKAALGGDMIANFESIPGLTDQWPNGYFRYGTTMHLSHLYEDVETWYKRYNYQERVDHGFRPGLKNVAPGTLTVPEGPSQVESEDENIEDVGKHGVVGHSAALQPATRLPVDLTDNYGNFYPAGSAVPNRADFNTLDNPFFWSADPERDKWSETPAAGLHFVVFVPSSAAFHRGRLAMDGYYSDGRVLKMDPRSPHQGMNSVIHGSHRQNFLVPPTAHRSFPLAELI